VNSGARRQTRSTWPCREPVSAELGVKLVLRGDDCRLAVTGRRATENLADVICVTGSVDDVTGMDEVVERILTTYDTISVVGASADPAKAAHGVPALMQRHGWRIIPVNLRGGTILGERAYRALAELPEQVGLVDVFRPSRQAADVARQAVAAGATALWLQLGISSAEARDIAEAAGLHYMENRCMAIEQRRLGINAPAASGPEDPRGRLAR
jgi:uncharacterized protein